MPDLCVLMTAVVLFILIRKMASNRKKEQPDSLHSVKVALQDPSQTSGQKINDHDKKRFVIFKSVGNISTLATLCISGAISPSIINLVYFVIFLSSSTYLAFNKVLFKKFAIMLKIASFMIFIQILSITSYQNPWFYSSNIFQTSIISRILGFKRIIIIDNAEHFNHFKINDEISSEMVLHPFVLILTYYVITFNSSYILVIFLK